MRRRQFLGAAAGVLAAPAVARAQTIGGTLVLYTSQLEPDAASTVEAFRRRHPQVQVEWIRGGTGQIMSRLRAEFAAGSPRPDVCCWPTASPLRAEGRRPPAAKPGRWRSAAPRPTGTTPAARISAPS